MIEINEFIINETLIKAATPYVKPLEEGEYGFWPQGTKILFTDGTEKVFMGLNTHDLYVRINNK